MAGNRLPKGLAKGRSDHMHPLYRRRNPFSSVPTNEQVEQRRQASVSAMDGILREQAVSKWGVAPEDADKFISDPDGYRTQQRVAEKLKDRGARIAVEGDTDANHDNIEAAE